MDKVEAPADKHAGGSGLVGQHKSITIRVLILCLLLVIAIIVLAITALARYDGDVASERHAPAVLADQPAAAALPRGNPGRYFGSDAYSASARRAGHEGRVITRLSIDASGRVRGCRIERSAGDAALDEATCRIARTLSFSPALAKGGTPIASSYPLAVRWILQH